MQSWDPDAETENPRRCLNCGDHVSSEFRRTHGDDDGFVHSCPSCDENHNLARTAAGFEPQRRFGGSP